jgi:OFA family oxalate/formate antiporter-like MFS transporter
VLSHLRRRIFALAAAAHHSLNGLYFGYGIIGLGMGMGYICPVATLVKWFPERQAIRALPSAVMDSARRDEPFRGVEIRHSVAAVSLDARHRLPGGRSAAAQFYANPPQGWRPAGWEPRTAVAKSASTIGFTVIVARRLQFYLLFCCSS